MKIGLLGCSSLPHQTTFAQLRTWSMQRFLEKQKLHVASFLLSDSDIHGHNVYEQKTMDALSAFCKNIDILITAGPFLPALVLDGIPENIPLWLDWPSDPLADFHAKQLVSQTTISDHSIVQELIRKAFFRADAIGVISQRQAYASLGQLLLLGYEMTPVSVIPIAYDFPFSPQTKQALAEDILIAGSMNTWLDLRQIVETLGTAQARNIHITGGYVPHFPEGKQLIKELQDRFTNLKYHGWIAEPELENVIRKCQYSVWLDQGDIEPLLGSRTRALFSIWHGLKIFGSTKTELADFLMRQQAMVEWDGRKPADIVFRQLAEINVEHAQSVCKQYFSPDVVYAPIVEWINNPVRVKKQPQDSVFLENQSLRREIRSVYQSSTWKILNRVHKLFG